MITKKLLHDIITFCNNYIDNKNILFDINKYTTFMNVSISVWSLYNTGMINNQIGTITLYIDNVDDFKYFKQKVLEELPKLLEQLNKK